MNTDSRGQIVRCPCLAGRHHVVCGTTITERPASGASYLCSSVSICGLTQSFRLSLLPGNRTCLGAGRVPAAGGRARSGFASSAPNCTQNGFNFQTAEYTEYAERGQVSVRVPLPRILCIPRF